MTREETIDHAGISKDLDMDLESALERTRKALAEEGFGILTRIDMQATLREKLGEEIGPWVILGACNPRLAHRAVGIEPQVTLFLPCNVVVREIEDGRIRVEAMNPAVMSRVLPSEELQAVASEAAERLGRAIDSI